MIKPIDMSVLPDKVLIERYKCNPADRVDWCNGTKRGKAIRCPRYCRTKFSEGVCARPSGPQLGMEVIEL